MGCIDTITYEKFPKQKDENYKYPKFKVGSRVKVCYHYDTSKYHYGTIVRDDLEEPFETIIKLDNGRYLRAVECQFSYIDEEDFCYCHHNDTDKLNIDEAIKFCYEKAKNIKLKAEPQVFIDIAELLEELKATKSSDIPIIHGKEELELHDKAIRNKAIDDFVKEICKMFVISESNGNYRFYAVEIKQTIADLAEKLKAGGENEQT